MVWKGFRDVQATIVIDVTKPEEELWNNGLDKDARWGVKKAEKEKLKVYETDKENEIRRFYEIYKGTCKYGGISPKPLEEIMRQSPVFFLCKKDGKIIAGAVVKKAESGFILYLNASLSDYLKYQPNNLLYWSIIKEAKKRGLKYFDLGGYQIGAKPGDKLYHINRFKERWGGEKKINYIYSYNPFYVLGRKLIRNSKAVKWLWDRIKGRPSQKRKKDDKAEKDTK